MKIFKQLSKKGYKHYYGGTVEELDSMNKDNQHLHSEIMQVVMWMYKKHSIWISVEQNTYQNKFDYLIIKRNLDRWIVVDNDQRTLESPIKAYEVAIEHVLNNLI